MTRFPFPSFSFHSCSPTQCASFCSQSTEASKSEGGIRRLELHGVGLKASLQKKTDMETGEQYTLLSIAVGRRSTLDFLVPRTLRVTCPNPRFLVISGPVRDDVSAFAAVIRRAYPPQPYSGAGIRYSKEFVRLSPKRKS